jgi:hypothetical protein
MSTILKLTIPTLVVVIGGISTMLYHFHRVRTHIETPEIHVRSESKPETQKARAAMTRTILERQDVKIREVKAEQREQINALAEKLDRRQRTILREVVRARRAAER